MCILYACVHVCVCMCVVCVLCVCCVCVVCILSNTLSRLMLCAKVGCSILLDRGHLVSHTQWGWEGEEEASGMQWGGGRWEGALGVGEKDRVIICGLFGGSTITMVCPVKP